MTARGIAPSMLFDRHPARVRTPGAGARRYCLSLAVSCFALVFSSGAVFAEEPEEYHLNLSKGLIHYSHGKYREAERYLSQAQSAKPGDPHAGYYLGQALIRLRRYGEAEERYREILQRHPDDARARLGLGMAQYHQAEYGAALTNLTYAEQSMPDDPVLFYYEGLAYSGVEAYDEAAGKFRRAAELSPDLTQEARYQAGLAYSAGGARDRADQEFHAVIAADPQSKLAQAARDSLQAGEGAGISQAPSKRWDLYLALSAQYDSNVVLLPSGTQPLGGGISRRDDFVSVLFGGGEYRFLQTDTWTAGAGYSLYQNLHARLSDFNVQDHTPTVYVSRRFGMAQLRLQYIFDYVSVGGDSYLLSHAFQPTVTIAESNRTFTLLLFRYQDKDFKEWDRSLDRLGVNQTRDGKNWMFGVSQYYLFPHNRGHVRGGYTFDADRTGGGDVSQAVPGVPSPADWAYNGHRFSAGVAYAPWTSTTFDLGFHFYRQDYLNANSFSDTGATERRDNIYMATVTGVRDVTSWLWVALQYSYTRDQANVAAFDYTRHIVSFTVGGQF